MTRRSITLALALSAALAGPVSPVQAQWVQEPCCLLPPALPPACGPGWGYAPPVVIITPPPQITVLPAWPQRYVPPPVVLPPTPSFNNPRTMR